MTGNKSIKSHIKKALALLLILSAAFLSVSSLIPASAEVKPIINKKAVSDKGFILAKDYNYAKPVRSNAVQPDSYMNRAVFLGDSRTVDLFIYSSLSKTDALAYCDVGLNVSSVNSKEFVKINSKSYTALEAMKKNKNKFDKAYLMFGVNELGYDTKEFIKLYNKLIDNIRKIKPDTVIYVQSILPVSKSKDNSDNLHNNQNVRIFNEEIRKMCENKKVFYVDMYQITANSEGYLPEFVAYDGVHFKRDYCEKWFTYLKKHTVIIS